MTTKDYSTATLWGIHGGRTGDADGIFLKKNQVALGWDAMGDLAALPGMMPLKRVYVPEPLEEVEA